MSPRLDGQLELAPRAVRYPGRHEVFDAVLRRGDERIAVVVKKVPLDLRQRLFGNKAERSEKTARALLARNVPTPEPMGVEVTGGESWYIARRLEGAQQIRGWFLHRDDATRPAPALPIPFEEVVAALGRLARGMHDSGVFFRDFTDGNILVTEEKGAPRLWLVDLNRARVSGSPVPVWSRLRDLSRPGLNRREDRKLLLRSYFDPAGAPGWAYFLVSALRVRILIWDDLKRRLRPWRRYAA